MWYLHRLKNANGGGLVARRRLLSRLFAEDLDYLPTGCTVVAIVQSVELSASAEEVV
jgi:hypothetical protein